jgi:type II secretory pathway pseudopilin PulG
MLVRTRGFTLYEVAAVAMVLAAFVGVVGARVVASSRRSDRAEATQALFLVTKTQDAFFASYKRYATSFEEIRYALKGKKFTVVTPAKIRGERYEITLTQPWGPASWLAVATGDLDGDPWPDLLAVAGSAGSSTTPVVMSDDLTHELQNVARPPGS